MKQSNRDILLLNKRAICILWQLEPRMFIELFLSKISNVVLTYATIYFSAQIVGELSGDRNPQSLLRLVTLLLALGIVLGMVHHYLEACYNTKKDSIYSRLHCLYSEKMLSLDFEKVDDVNVQNLRSQIIGNENWRGYGLKIVVSILESLLESVLGIVGALALTIGLFTTKVELESLQWMNHPMITVCFFLLMIFFALLSSMLTNKHLEMIANCYKDTTFGNRMFSYICKLGRTHEYAMDLRFYNQMKPCIQLYEKNKIWGKGTKLDRLEKGIGGVLVFLANVVSYAFVGIIYLLVCLKAYGKAFGIGAVTQHIGAATALFTNVSDFIENIGEVKVNTEFLRQTYELLDIPNEMYQGSLTVEKRSDRKYEVEFRNVSFRYPNTEIDVLKNVNMKFNIGEKLAIVGENGSGKTTFIKLLCRLYDPTEGEILLNGINIKKYNYKEYMSVFSVVFQDFKLFALPLGENVAATRNYDRTRVIECLKQAGFDERFCNMEHGLDTFLYKDYEETGVEISGGEEQKIALARALYQNAPFLILDEPTAALDPIAEAEVYSKFNEIVGDRTAVYISHRLSSCKFCDVIAVFDHGKVIEQGTHDNLVTNTNSKYYELWSAQAQYYV